MRKSAVFVISICLVLLFLGCQKKEGPAEKLGKKIDESVDNVGSKFKDALSETKKKIGNATENLKKSVDSFGNRMKKDTESSTHEKEDSDK
ncbi:MAG: hypothetical protein WCA04_10090 [Geobacteraceae bacterium]